jgi:tetratricopeptide (TPR) repeat protein
MPKKPKPKKAPKEKKATNAEKKALSAAVAVPFDEACELHTQAEQQPPSQCAALFKAACGKYREALALKPNDLNTLYNLGTALLAWAEAWSTQSASAAEAAQADKLRAKACERFQEVVSADTSKRSDTRAHALGSLVGALAGGGDLALQRGDCAGAERIYAEACAMEPSLPQTGTAWYNLGQVYRTLMTMALDGHGSQQQARQLGAQAVRCFETGLTCVKPRATSDLCGHAARLMAARTEIHLPPRCTATKD